MAAGKQGLPAEVLAWVEAEVGGSIVDATRQPGGARKQAWVIDVKRPDGSIAELFVRYDPSDPNDRADPWTLQREASVYLALQGRGVAVPRVLSVHPVHQAMLAERMRGENWFSRITDPAEAEATAKDFMVQLAALHRIDPRSLDIPGFPEPISVPEMVRYELDEFESILAARGGGEDPALRFALGWLRANIPAYEGPVVLVQGDTGPGNFMYGKGRVVAVVDWELAHFGDPMDDIAWLSLRAVQEPFTHLPARLAEYEVLSGHRLDLARIRYYRVMAETKLQVMRHNTRGGAASGADLGNGMIYGILHKRLWLEAMADVLELERQEAEVPPSPEPRGHEWLYDGLLEQLRTLVVPRVEDDFARTRLKGFARVIKHLRDVDRDGRFYEERELDDVEAALFTRLASVSEARVAMADAHERGVIDDSAYLRYLWRRVARENELLRSASGVLADRHWPSLTD